MSEKKELSRRSYLKYAAAATVAAGLGAAGLYAGYQLSPKPKERIEIRIVTDETNPTVVAEMNRAALEYEETTDVRVKVQPSYMGGMANVLAAGIAAGDMPEIAWGGGMSYVIELARLGELMPLTGVIDEIGRDKFYDTAVDEATWRNDVWMAPMDIEPNMFWYRKDLYEEHGLPTPPETWDDLLEASEVLNNPPEMYGTVVPLGLEYMASEGIFLPNFWQNNGLICDADLNVVIDRDPYLTRTIETLDYLKQLQKYSPPGSANYSYSETYTAFVSEAAASCGYWARVLEVMSRTNPSMLKKYGCCPFPRPKGGMLAAKGGAEGVGVLKKSKHPDAAVDYVKWYYTSDSYLRWLHTVPAHLWPARKDVAESAEFRNNPLLLENPEVPETVQRLLPVCYTTSREPNGIRNVAGDSGAYLYAVSELVQSVVWGNEDAETAISAFAKKIRQFIEEAKSYQ